MRSLAYIFLATLAVLVNSSSSSAALASLDKLVLQKHATFKSYFVADQLQHHAQDPSLLEAQLEPITTYLYSLISLEKGSFAQMPHVYPLLKDYVIVNSMIAKTYQAQQDTIRARLAFERTCPMAEVIPTRMIDPTIASSCYASLIDQYTILGMSTAEKSQSLLDVRLPFAKHALDADNLELVVLMSELTNTDLVSIPAMDDVFKLFLLSSTIQAKQSILAMAQIKATLLRRRVAMAITCEWLSSSSSSSSSSSACFDDNDGTNLWLQQSQAAFPDPWSFNDSSMDSNQVAIQEPIPYYSDGRLIGSDVSNAEEGMNLQLIVSIQLKAYVDIMTGLLTAPDVYYRDAFTGLIFKHPNLLFFAYPPKSRAVYDILHATSLWRQAVATRLATTNVHELLRKQESLDGEVRKKALLAAGISDLTTLDQLDHSNPSLMLLTPQQVVIVKQVIGPQIIISPPPQFPVLMSISLAKSVGGENQLGTAILWDNPRENPMLSNPFEAMNRDAAGTDLRKKRKKFDLIAGSLHTNMPSFSIDQIASSLSCMTIVLKSGLVSDDVDLSSTPPVIAPGSTIDNEAILGLLSRMRSDKTTAPLYYHHLEESVLAAASTSSSSSFLIVILLFGMLMTVGIFVSMYCRVPSKKVVLHESSRSNGSIEEGRSRPRRGPKIRLADASIVQPLSSSSSFVSYSSSPLDLTSTNMMSEFVSQPYSAFNRLSFLSFLRQEAPLPPVVDAIVKPEPVMIAARPQSPEVSARVNNNKKKNRGKKSLKPKMREIAAVVRGASSEADYYEEEDDDDDSSNSVVDTLNVKGSEVPIRQNNIIDVVQEPVVLIDEEQPVEVQVEQLIMIEQQQQPVVNQIIIKQEPEAQSTVQAGAVVSYVNHKDNDNALVTVLRIDDQSLLAAAAQDKSVAIIASETNIVIQVPQQTVRSISQEPLYEIFQGMLNATPSGAQEEDGLDWNVADEEEEDEEEDDDDNMSDLSQNADLDNNDAEYDAVVHEFGLFGSKVVADDDLKDSGFGLGFNFDVRSLLAEKPSNSPIVPSDSSSTTSSNDDVKTVNHASSKPPASSSSSNLLGQIVGLNLNADVHHDIGLDDFSFDSLDNFDGWLAGDDNDNDNIVPSTPARKSGLSAFDSLLKSSMSPPPQEMTEPVVIKPVMKEPEVPVASEPTKLPVAATGVVDIPNTVVIGDHLQQRKIQMDLSINIEDKVFMGQAMSRTQYFAHQMIDYVNLQPLVYDSASQTFKFASMNFPLRRSFTSMNEWFLVVSVSDLLQIGSIGIASSVSSSNQVASREEMLELRFEFCISFKLNQSMNHPSNALWRESVVHIVQLPRRVVLSPTVLNRNQTCATFKHTISVPNPVVQELLSICSGVDPVQG